MASWHLNKPLVQNIYSKLPTNTILIKMSCHALEYKITWKNQLRLILTNHHKIQAMQSHRGLQPSHSTAPGINTTIHYNKPHQCRFVIPKQIGRSIKLTKDWKVCKNKAKTTCFWRNTFLTVSIVKMILIDWGKVKIYEK